jgi:flagellin-like protein
MKGISPLVATVLLIAATMSVAMILSFWASSFVRTSLPSPANETQKMCQFADFDIYQCNYNSTNNTLDITLQNLRPFPIEKIVLYLSFPNGTTSQVSELGTLPAGAYQSYRVYDVPSFSKVIVRSVACVGIMPDKEKVC